MSGSLSGLSLRNIKGTYFWNLEETARKAWTSTLAQDVTSDQSHEIHKWLGGVPAQQVWDGERRRKSLTDFDLTVVNDKFESTLTFDMDDVRRDKTGQILRRVSELGQKAATLPQRLFTTLLGTAHSDLGYDGAAFFANAHNHGGTVDNLLVPTAAAPATPTSAEMEGAILGSVQAMMGFTDDRGDPANEFATAFTVMVPTNHWQASMAALKNDFTSAGVSNTLVNTGLQISVVVNPRLADTAAFYTFRTDAPVKAMIWQEESVGAEQFKTLGMDSDEAFWRDSISMGTKRIGQAALGRFELAAKSTLTV
jgi:phage major head subunit gpT-like protein